MAVGGGGRGQESTEHKHTFQEIWGWEEGVLKPSVYWSSYYVSLASLGILACSPHSHYVKVSTCLLGYLPSAFTNGWPCLIFECINIAANITWHAFENSASPGNHTPMPFIPWSTSFCSCISVSNQVFHGVGKRAGVDIKVGQSVFLSQGQRFHISFPCIIFSKHAPCRQKRSKQKLLKN